MSERKVAYIGKIIDIQPIKGADFIVSATVVCGEGGKWIGTVRKNEFKVDDMVEVYLQDALLPKTEEFEFMEQHKYRVTMRRFKKVPSECLIMPMSLNMTKYGLIGTSIDDVKDIIKYEKPIPACLSGVAKGNFPTHLISKTDEPNFQTAGRLVHALKGQKYYATVKADGSSGTIYKHDNHFGCCSRNLELKEDTNPVVWRLARKYDLERIFPNDMAIQFEMVGPGIQGNRMKLDKIDMRIFNVYSIKERKYFDAAFFIDFCKVFSLPTVEIIKWDEIFDFEDNEALRKFAEGKYTGTKEQREGVVFRPMIETKVGHQRLSFKVINLLYKD
jgi:RNA ligase (TIGR02306 family)